MKYKLKESQYNRLLKELESQYEQEENPENIDKPIIDKGIDKPIIDKGIEELPSLSSDDAMEPFKEPEMNKFTVEQKLKFVEGKMIFLEDFFRDVVDFTEFFVSETDDNLKELSKGEIDISRVRERLEKLTTRGGRKKFYAAKRGLR